MAVSLGPSGLVLDNINIPNNASNTVLQAKSVGYSSALGTSDVTTNGTNVDLMSITMTVQANSKVMMWFDSHQLYNNSTAANPNVRFNIDGTNVGSDSNHYFYGFSGRPVIHKICMSAGLSAGSHVFKVIGNTYNGPVTYNYQANNGGSFMIQEIAE